MAGWSGTSTQKRLLIVQNMLFIITSDLEIIALSFISPLLSFSLIGCIKVDWYIIIIVTNLDQNI